jgi:hypothetical protein
LPACAWLISWTDLTMSGATLDTKALWIRLSTRATSTNWPTLMCQHLSIAEIRSSRLYSRICAASTDIDQVGSAETLLSDATRFAAAAGSSDVDVTLEIWPHAVTHSHCGMRNRGRRRALTKAGEFIRAQGQRL